MSVHSEEIFKKAVLEIVPNPITESFRSRNVKEYKEFVKHYKRYGNLFIEQPPIDLIHKTNNKHADFSLHTLEHDHVIEVKTTDDADTIYSTSVYSKHSVHEYVVVLVGELQRFNDTIKNQLKKFGVKVYSLGEYVDHIKKIL